MKVILYMATSVNGFIAKTDHDTPWTAEEFESHSNMVKKAGNLILGKTTFDLMHKENAFVDLNESFVVVLTSSKEKPPRDKTVYAKNFKEAIKILEEKGFSTALVGGGGQADTAALDSGMLDELYVDVEPVVFGRGIPLFTPSDNDMKLKLLETKKIGKSGIQLHYKVLN